MNGNKWAANVLLVNADFLDHIANIFRANHKKTLGREIPKADLATWIECAMIDGGMRAGDEIIQVVFLHDQNAEKLENFSPANFSDELNAKGFKSNLGEVRVASFPAFNAIVSTEDFFNQTAENIFNAKEVERVVLVGHFAEKDNNVIKLLKEHAEKSVTLLTDYPVEDENISQSLLGFSISFALGITDEEIQQAK